MSMSSAAQYATTSSNPLPPLCAVGEPHPKQDHKGHTYANTMSHLHHHTTHLRSSHPMHLVHSLCTAHTKLLRHPLEHNPCTTNTYTHHSNNSNDTNPHLPNTLSTHDNPHSPPTITTISTTHHSRPTTPVCTPRLHHNSRNCNSPTLLTTNQPQHHSCTSSQKSSH